MDNHKIIIQNKNDFPEFESIRNIILEAGEKVATTVNFGQGFDECNLRICVSFMKHIQFGAQCVPN